MTTATVEREELQHLIQVLPDEKIPAALFLMNDLCYENHVPNEETIAAFHEAENLDNLTTCASLEDMLIQCGINR